MEYAVGGSFGGPAASDDRRGGLAPGDTVVIGGDEDDQDFLEKKIEGEIFETDLEHLSNAEHQRRIADDDVQKILGESHMDRNYYE